MLIIKPIVICIVSLIIILFLKKVSPEFVPVIAIITGVMIVIYIFPYIQSVLSFFSKAENISGEFESVFETLIKIMTISLACEFASQICSDGGETYLAGKINFAGKIIILSVITPDIIAFIDYIVEMIEKL